MSLRKLSPALRISLIYIILGCLWIIITDHILLQYIDDIESMRIAQSVKGWFYVTATALLLFFLVRNSIIKHDRSRAEYMEKLKDALDKAEESNRLKTAFLNNLSHEIRTPMNAVVGFSDLLRDEVKDKKSKEYISSIQKSSYRLLDIINDIISIATIESDQERFLEDKLRLWPFLEGIADDFSVKASEKGLGFKYASDPGQNSEIVFADKEKLGYVISHLLNNAIKFTDSGSVEFRCTLKGDVLHFAVSDTGKGVPENLRKVIFERFRKGEYMSNSELNEGMGLGLPIAKAYIELMGGRIEVSSSPGKGSVFSFTVPCKSVPDEPEDKKAGPVTVRGNTILIAEDEHSNYTLVETILEPYGFELIHARNGEEALEAVRKRPEINLVLMDIKMPVMNGLDATRLIKAERPALPVIAVTAYALKGDEENILGAGCDGYLAKPVRKATLLETIGRYVKAV